LELLFGLIKSRLQRLLKLNDCIAVVRVSVPALLSTCTLDTNQLLNATSKLRYGVGTRKKFGDQSRETLATGGLIPKSADFTKILAKGLSCFWVKCLSHELEYLLIWKDERDGEIEGRCAWGATLS